MANTSMFFKANAEKKIGFKRLSDADLGLSLSHQTHIGLYEGILDFLPDKYAVKTAMLIYDSYCDILECSFDRIQNPDGTYRSPKIRIGDSDDSLVQKIREFAKRQQHNEWFLIWFGLESEELVFWLFNNKSQDYASIMNVFDEKTKIIDGNNVCFNNALEMIENKLDNVSIKIQEDLEIISQTGASIHKYMPKDIEKAQKRFRNTGRNGEELINEYLDKKKTAGEINSYDWVNKNFESGAPYDFIIDGTKYMDVKSTLYKFDQPLIFSNQEIDFVNNTNDESYSVFRVYDLNEEEKKLRICKKCHSYMNRLSKTIVDFNKKVISENAKMHSVKLGIKPVNSVFENIMDSITLI